MKGLRIASCLFAQRSRSVKRCTVVGVHPSAGFGSMDNDRQSFPLMKPLLLHQLYSCTASSEEQGNINGTLRDCLTHQETHKILKLMKVEDLKQQLQGAGKDSMLLDELIKLCKRAGTACSNGEAEEIARSLDEAGVILIFRGKVFLHPKRVADLLSTALPAPLVQDDDPRRQEFAQLVKEKEKIDQMALTRVRRMLWIALGAYTLQSLLIFRLTFWELSWDVMEPIAFFITSSSIIAGFLFFILTHRDPSYQDIMHAFLSSKQRKLMKKRNFNVGRLKELQMQLCTVHHDKAGPGASRAM